MQKPNKHRPSLTKRQQYKISNWKAYNQALKQRGSLEIWVESDVVTQWYYQGVKKQGGQYVYSDACIEMAMVVREVYHLKYRQLEGFLESLTGKLGWEVAVPDYTVINRRARRLGIDIKVKEHREKSGGKIYMVVDSTGLKVFGEGEWKVRGHGWSKHRTWMKFHVGVDEGSAIVESCELTTNAVDDAAVTEALLDAAVSKIKKLAGDGAYDKKKVYNALAKRKIKPAIPPRKNARISRHGNQKGKPLPRDKNIRAIRRWGRKRWKQKIKYHRRNMAETTMFRYKTIFGDKLNSRTEENQKTEVRIKCKILNVMTRLGMPETILLRKAA